MTSGTKHPQRALSPSDCTGYGGVGSLRVFLYRRVNFSVFPCRLTLPEAQAAVAGGARETPRGHFGWVRRQLVVHHGHLALCIWDKSAKLQQRLLAYEAIIKMLAIGELMPR